jgi:transcriptional regulator with XRE-family HTH domain
MQFLPRAIRVAREKRGWTQEDLADRLDVTQSTISFWENGVEIPSLHHQVRLVESMPDIMRALAIQELNLLDRLQTLERTVFNGKCGCEGCGCSANTPVTPISSTVHEREV